MCQTARKIALQKKIMADFDEWENQFTGLGDGPPPKKSRAKWEIFNGANGQFYFHLRADNGKIILQSEGYTTKANALKGIQSVRHNVGAPVFEIIRVEE